MSFVPPPDLNVEGLSRGNKIHRFPWGESLMLNNSKFRRYNEETKFPVTPSFVLTHSSDSIPSDECASTKLGVTGNFVSSLYLLIQSSTL